jgi:hypothetical protein
VRGGGRGQDGGRADGEDAGEQPGGAVEHVHAQILTRRRPQGGAVDVDFA